ncbi:MAG TPA: flagellar brake protein, partial [Candidatus Wallbacteria bacterium]|nr:flagellar brake protein [Candidatus Wallbacteria bacterium]
MAGEQQANTSTTYFEVTNLSSLEKYLSRGQVVEIEVKLGLFAGQYKSRVSNMSDKVLNMSVPSVASKHIHIWEKTVCHLNYMRSDGMYTFITHVIKSEIYPKPILNLAVPEKIEKIQRRRY